MFTHRILVCAAWLAFSFASNLACAEGPNLGIPIDPTDIREWDITVMPDGTGLPPGSGTPAQGARIYAEKCVACHGENGSGGPYGAVVGGGPLIGPGSV